MKHLLIKKTAVFVLAAITLVLVSWTGTNDSGVKDLSDEEIFSGLVFMKGKVANMVPELKEVVDLQAKLVTSPQDRQQIDKLQNQIVERIKLKYPKYLAHFKNVITSGNHYAIDAALQKANEYTTDVLGDILGINFSDLHSKKDAVTKLLGNKVAQLKDLYRRFQVGELTDVEFTMANDALLADKKDELVAIFSHPTAFNNSQAVAGAQGTCIAVNLAFALNVVTYANVAVTLNIYAMTNVYWGTNYWSGGGDPWVVWQSLAAKASVNSIAKVFKQ